MSDQIEPDTTWEMPRWLEAVLGIGYLAAIIVAATIYGSALSFVLGLGLGLGVCVVMLERHRFRSQLVAGLVAGILLGATIPITDFVRWSTGSDGPGPAAAAVSAPIHP